VSRARWRGKGHRRGKGGRGKGGIPIPFGTPFARAGWVRRLGAVRRDDELRYDPPAPVAIVTLRAATGGPTVPNVSLLLDTGADAPSRQGEASTDSVDVVRTITLSPTL
jgi:hypothetical protein